MSNIATVSQRASDCGEIRFHFKVDASEITPAIVERAERELRANPGHQSSYYDLLLVDATGRELDFETNILCPEHGRLKAACPFWPSGWSNKVTN